MRNIIGLTIATAINILAMAIIIPVLPFHILSLGGSALQATVIYSVFSAASVITVSFWGRMSDRFGRKRILIISIGITSFSYLWLTFADSLWQIYAARALAGAFAAWLPVSQAFVGDVIPSHRRAAAMGMLGAAFGVGFTIGPLLGGYLASVRLWESYAFALPYTLSAVLAGACLLVTLIAIPEPSRQNATPSSASVSQMLRKPLVLPLIALYFGVSLTFTGVEGVLTVWSSVTLDWQPQDVGIALMIAGLGSIFTQGYLIRLCCQRLGEANTIIIGIAVIGLGLLGLSATQHDIATIILLVMLGVGLGLNNPATQSLLSQVAPEHLRGGIMGIAQAAASSARVLGPIWAGLLFEHYAGNTPFYAGTVMALMLMGSAIMIMRQHGKNPAA